ncbi:signal peptidase II [Boudabousia liubingyangii]|uniref:Lipoprotein signal peptidase n=1 Tax=Boudabousia liubingyangii TaxID=1921764 RepID=A0A1Q5PN71_9ACTO|nr:signal peptidase II [Boudabousia liubingyangii]OKL47552.1 signal peptidase II [Boudabousia liubingyangii]OKL48976.1 signal peptidase II [Boudabousia liubingyangii]
MPAKTRSAWKSPLFWNLAILSLLIDQGTKLWALKSLGNGRIIQVPGGFFSLKLVHNPGAAFSMGTGRTWIFALIAAIVSIGILYFSRQVTNHYWIWGLSLLLSGAVGNLIDRLFQPPAWGRGHVVDFIAYGDYFVGNVADIWIFIAAVGIALLAFRGVGIND